MYYLIYIPLYLLSLIPLRILYFFGDGIYGLLYYVFGYRKKVVMDNLAIAFPEKTEAERKKIAKGFYHNFVDTFIETIKLLSMSDASFDKRFSADFSGLEEAYKYGKSIHVVGMHNFNWEFANLGLSKNAKYPVLAIYMPIANKAFDKIIINLRTRFGSIMLPATNFRRSYFPYIKQLHILANVGDQSPGTLSTAYWAYFFGKITAFVTGPEKGTRASDSVLVFAHFYKTKRGHYRLDTKFVTADARSYPEGGITKTYVQFLEECIRKHPDNYLWSHRRWKHQYDPKYGDVIQ